MLFLIYNLLKNDKYLSILFGVYKNYFYFCISKNDK